MSGGPAGCGRPVEIDEAAATGVVESAGVGEVLELGPFVISLGMFVFAFPCPRPWRLPRAFPPRPLPRFRGCPLSTEVVSLAGAVLFPLSSRIVTVVAGAATPAGEPGGMTGIEMGGTRVVAGTEVHVRNPGGMSGDEMAEREVVAGATAMIAASAMEGGAVVAVGEAPEVVEG